MTTKKKDDRRSELFTLRISDDERERLEAVAKEAGTGAAEVIRLAVNAACDVRGVEHVFRSKVPA
jgi:predicted DNA-binding protein